MSRTCSVPLAPFALLRTAPCLSRRPLPPLACDPCTLRCPMTAPQRALRCATSATCAAPPRCKRAAAAARSSTAATRTRVRTGVAATPAPSAPGWRATLRRPRRCETSLHAFPGAATRWRRWTRSAPRAAASSSCMASTALPCGAVSALAAPPARSVRGVTCQAHVVRSRAAPARRAAAPARPARRRGRACGGVGAAARRRALRRRRRRRSAAAAAAARLAVVLLAPVRTAPPRVLASPT